MDKKLITGILIVLVFLIVASILLITLVSGAVHEKESRILSSYDLEIPSASLKTKAMFGAKVQEKLAVEKKVRVIVTLKDPEKIKTWTPKVSAMGKKELKDLKSVMRDSAIQDIGHHLVKHKYGSFNGFSAALTQKEFDALSSSGLIESIEYDEPVHAFLQDSVGIINATESWSLQYNGVNLTGAGQTVCVIDTGVDYTHPDLGGCSIENVTMDGNIINYTVESVHNYTDNETVTFRINYSGFESMAAHFVNISTELNWDYVKIFDGNANQVAVYSGYHTDFWSPSVDGGIIYVQLVADDYINDYGFYIDKIINGTTNSTPDWSNCSKVIGGWDILNSDSDPMDDNNHGTHCAGIVAAGGGIKGVAPDANIVAIKALDQDGAGWGSDIIAGIEYCTSNAERYNISVISMSLGGGLYTGYCDANYPSFSDAINSAVAKNISIIVASGNDNNISHIAAPACIQNATPVGATEKNDDFAGYSNRNWMVQLFAPGSSINSTWYPGGGYNPMSGTSMATPHIAGAVAIMNQYLNLLGQTKTPQEIESIFNATGKQIIDTGYSDLAYSMIDLYEALLELDVISPDITIISPETDNVAIEDYTFINITSDETLYNTILHINTSQNISMNGSGQNWYYNLSWNEFVTFFITAEDLAGNTGYTENITIFLNNTAPNITNSTPAAVVVNISEPENQTFLINYSDYGPYTSVKWYIDSVLAANGTTEWNFTGNYSSAGNYNISVIVNDSVLYDSASWILIVNNSDAPPTIDSYQPLADPTILEPVNYTFNITASDIDSDNISYSWKQEGIAVAATQNFTFLGNDSSSGIWNISVTVTSTNLTAYQEWSLTVIGSEGCLGLTNNMSISNDIIICRTTYSLANGISINNSNIIIDCNGSTLRGSNSSSAVTFANVTNSTLKNCIIEDYAYGISIEHGGDNEVSNIVVSDSAESAIILSDSSDNVIINSNFSNNYDGIAMNGTVNSTITDNYIQFNQDIGILILENSVDDMIQNNTISNNTIYDAANIQASNISLELNFWGTSNMSLIAGKISDYNDNSSLGSIDFDPWWVTDTFSVDSDFDNDNYSSTQYSGTDCNDSESSINPGVEEISNGIDDNCDGLIDNEISIKGNASAINSSTISGFIIYVDNSTDLQQEYEDIFIVNITNSTHALVYFDFNFTNSSLNLSTITIEKQSSGAGSGYIFVKGLNLTEQGKTKTAHIDKVNSTLSSVCIKDAEIDSISDISNLCNESDEHPIACPGVSGDYNCSFSEDNQTFIISGLAHSGVKQQTYCGDGTKDPDEECDGTDFGGETCITQGYDRGTLSCKSTCIISTNICAHAVPSSSGGGGGGGSRTTTTAGPTGPKYSRFFSNLEAGTTIIDIVHEEIAVERLRVTTTEQNKMVNFIVQKINDTSVIKSPPANAYQYLRIEGEGIEDSTLSGIMHEFTISKSWFGTRYNKDKVYLQRYHNGAWEKNPAAFIKEDNFRYFYEAETKGLSYFAITADDIVAERAVPTVTEIQERAEEQPENEVEKEEPKAIAPEPVPEELEAEKGPGFISKTLKRFSNFMLGNMVVLLLVILLLVVIGGSGFNMYYYYKRFIKEEDDYEEEEIKEETEETEKKEEETVPEKKEEKTEVTGKKEGKTVPEKKEEKTEVTGKKEGKTVLEKKEEKIEVTGKKKGETKIIEKKEKKTEDSPAIILNNKLKAKKAHHKQNHTQTHSHHKH